MIQRAPALIALVMLLASCGAAPATPGTGIEGIVEVAPTCPVERINSPCPPHRMAATIVIKDSRAVEVARVTSGADGHFKVNLPAGSYTLIGLMVGGSMLPRPIPTSAVVNPGRYTSVTVEYDSGIR
jgi:hypothetical protein